MKKRAPSLVCRIGGCPRKGVPFESLAAKGSHRRRVHGLRAISKKIKRPAGGTEYCDVVDPETGKCCDVAPYVTKGGLGLHKNRDHGIVSKTLDAIKKSQYRNDQRVKRTGEAVAPTPASAPRRPAYACTDALPAIPGAPVLDRRPRCALNAGQQRIIARRLLWLVQIEWPRGLPGGAHPLDVRDAIAEIVNTNFAALRRSDEPDTIATALGASPAPPRRARRGTRDTYSA